jgi:hypothetical protein
VSNLNRQILHWTESGQTQDGFRPGKDPPAQSRRGGQFPPSGAGRPPTPARIVAEYDVVLSAVDNLESRLILNEACFETGVAWIDGGSTGSPVWLASMSRPGGPAIVVLNRRDIEGNGDTRPCFLGALAGTIGTLQAQEALSSSWASGSPGRSCPFLRRAGAPLRRHRDPSGSRLPRVRVPPGRPALGFPERVGTGPRNRRRLRAVGPDRETSRPRHSLQAEHDLRPVYVQVVFPGEREGYGRQAEAARARTPMSGSSEVPRAISSNRRVNAERTDSIIFFLSRKMDRSGLAPQGFRTQGGTSGC